MVSSHVRKQALLGLADRDLPLLWDCDFLLGEKTASDGDEDRYVLCEINVSSVSPFPESALEPLAGASGRGKARARKLKA